MARGVNREGGRVRLLREGYVLMERGRYPDAVIFLERVVKSDPKDVKALILLAAANLYAGRFAEAGVHLERIRTLDPGYMPLLEIEGFMALKGAPSRDAALSFYLDLIDRCPADRMLHRARRLIMASTDFAALQKNARLADYVDLPAPSRFRALLTGAGEAERDSPRLRGARSPGRRRRPVLPAKRILLAAAGLLAAGAAAFTVYRFAGQMKESKHPERDAADRVSLTGLDHELGRKIAPASVAVFYKTPHELGEDFNRARTLLKNGDHNGSLYFLNRVLNSNANFMAREKARFLIKFIADSEDRTFLAIPVERIRKETYLYQGFAVRLQGVVQSPRKRQKGTHFVLKTGTAAPEEVDVYVKGPQEGIRDGMACVVEGVVADFTGRERRIYLVAGRVEPL